MGDKGRWIAAVAVTVAVLLPAGVLAAGSVDRPSASAGAADRVGAAGVELQGVDEGPAASGPTGLPTEVSAPGPPSTIPAVVPAVPPSVTPRSVTTTTPVPTAPAPATSPPAPTMVPGAPGPKAGATSWAVDQNGISLRMRMDPAAPVAGQAVRFILDVSSVEPCCAMGLTFGDGPDFTPVSGGSCASRADLTGVVVPHTYAGPGTYKVLFVATTFPCKATKVDGQFVPPPISGATIAACVAIGPVPSAQNGC